MQPQPASYPKPQPNSSLRSSINGFDGHVFSNPQLSITLLGSGSSGNATLLRYNHHAILIDAGLSLRQIQLRLASLNLSLDCLQAILLTHEHNDHTAALPTLTKKFNIPLYSNSLTADAIRYNLKIDNAIWNYFPNGCNFEIGPFDITPFRVPHDASDPVGFVIRTPSHSVAILTDLGMTPQSVLHSIQNVNALIIEANYDPELLNRDRKRPWSIKQRISSRHGHLCNSATAQAITQVASPNLQLVVLCHLSADCNSPELAFSTVQDALRNTEFSHIPIHCAPRDHVSPTFQL